jgi:hypothetical protein
MAKRKATPLERVHSNRLRHQIEAKYNRITPNTPIKDLLNIIHSCADYLPANEQYADGMMKDNVKTVRAIRQLVKEEYNRRLASWSIDLNSED